MSIKHLSEDDRPREKFLTKGKGAVSDSELLAIIMGSGNRTQTAVELARDILKYYEYNWHLLSEASIEDLKKFKGIGEAKAISIATALEIGRRRALQEFPKRASIKSSQMVFELMQPLLSDLLVEEFWVLLVNQNNQVIHKEALSKGGLTGTVVDLRLLFKLAIERYATGIILVHNHPSGSLTPSLQDKTITQKIVKAGQILNIKVLDHIIIAKQQYFSFLDEGLL
ncbi:RadC family protein [Riemerella columbina]|uniref:RadC family protein n=1 Tax=Riemerella columbina TaxID=103810 RepID=UPI000375B88A|nr:DNA repair protein RadC [Riemerella columbina]